MSESRTVKCCAGGVLFLMLLLPSPCATQTQGQYVNHLPAVASMPGGRGNAWTSEVQFLNPNAHPQAVRCTYYPRMDIHELPVTVEIALPPHAQVEYRGTLFTDLFGLPDTPRAGALKVEALSPQEGDEGIILTSQILSKNADGTYVGQDYSSVEPWEVIRPGSVRYLNTSGDWGAFRYNFLALALQDGTGFEIALVDCIGGEPLASPEALQGWSEGQNMQFDLEQHFRGIPENVLLRIRGIAGSVVVRGSLVDDVTNDPMALKVIRGAHKEILIELANAAGIEVNFRHTATLTNLGPDPAVLDAEYYPRGGVDGIPASTAVLTLDPCKADEYSDILGTVLGAEGEAMGTLVFTLSGNTGKGFAAHGRSYGLPDAGGTLGQLIPEMTDTDAIIPSEAVYFNGLRDLESEEGIERANVSLFNPMDREATVHLRLLAPASTAGGPDEEAGSMDISLAPKQLVRINRIIPTVNASLRGTVSSARLEMEGDGEFYAMVSQLKPGGDGISILPGNGHSTWEGLNEPPAAMDDSFTTDENTPIHGDILANDTDDGLPSGILTAILVSGPNPTQGTLTAFNENGNFTFSPATDFVGTVVFTYKASDGELESNVATVRITVRSVNTPPTADPQELATEQNLAVLITLTGSDADSDPLTFSIDTPPANGSLSGLTQVPPASATVTYTPAVDYVGSDSFIFMVDDGNGGTATATVWIAVYNVGISLKKYTNGQDADAAPGPDVEPSQYVGWSYDVTNTSAVALTNILVNDDQQGNICTIATLAPGAISNCFSGVTSHSPGPYENLGTVTATTPGGQTLTDTDPSHFYGRVPSILIKKYTNSDDADTMPGPILLAGSTVAWTYVVTNTGDTNLSSIAVTDDQGVAVICPAAALAPGASMTCTAFGTAVSGQYSNIGTVTSLSPAGLPVSDTDPSHYFGATPAVSIKKYTGGQDADTLPGPVIVAGGVVAWTYVVTNTGNTNLNTVSVTDNKGVTVSCPKSILVPGESMTCTAAGTAITGQYSNIGTVTATPPSGPTVTASDPSHYCGGAGTGSIFGFVFNDLNGNGVYDASETGLSGVTVTASTASGESFSTLSNEWGQYAFSICAGTYNVAETNPSGWTSTTPDSVMTVVPPGGSAAISFGDILLTHINGVVFNDLDGDGIQDAGELGIPAVTITLDGTYSTTTVASGVYNFDLDLPTGYRTIVETDPPGMTSTTPNTVTFASSPGGTYVINYGDQ